MESPNKNKTSPIQEKPENTSEIIQQKDKEMEKEKEIENEIEEKEKENVEYEWDAHS